MPVCRPAGLRDALALSALAERTFRETFSGANSPEDMALHCKTSYGEAAQASEIADPAMCTLLCEEGGRLIGFAQLRWGWAPACVKAVSPGEIQRLYVDSAWHGKGVAQGLMEECLAQMRTHRTDVVWLGVWERNPRAISFYRKFGFRDVGEHTFLLGKDVQRDIVMARNTTPNN